MIRVDLPDLLFFCAVPGRRQETVIGKNRSVESTAIHIIRAYLQAQSTLEALCRGILMRVITVGGWLVLPDVYGFLLQILLNGRPVHNQIPDDLKLLQGPNLDLLSFQIPDIKMSKKRFRRTALI